MKLKLLASALFYMLVSSSHAAIYAETGDAGQTLGTAQSVAANTTQINGTLGVAGDVDLYKLVFAANATVTFYAPATNIDSNLILFDAAGHGLWGDDDGGGGLDSQIVFNVTPGTYYLAFGDNNIDARDSSNIVFCANDDGDCTDDPISVLDHFGSDSEGATGPYTITLSSPAGGASTPQAIPTLSEWGMILLAGLLAFGTALGLRRQRR
ncbi:IPTL-CTERM sorting domain-containing protein [Rhodoferax sp.]|uniref:IPTL-CTERM sorting domain-containing protein n=1 Tax=Rhodoferax sp. TaxID=50421 RepID=UPI0026110A80|nr:IPTL-CTERM sorting domain-containing protein [Rhodoferax sp.]MDD2919823.1 IPTL-CTERM sorting domain-containing protein [Rhodoferax sp.]